MPTIVEQGKLTRTDTGINLVNWKGSSKPNIANKLVHNTNQIVMADIYRPRLNVSKNGIGTPTPVYSDYPFYIDGIIDVNAKEGYYTPSNIYEVIVGFDNTPAPFTCTWFYVYSKLALTPASMIVSFSFDNITYTPVTSGATWSLNYDNINDVYIYFVLFSTNKVGNYIKLTKTDNGTLGGTPQAITEQIVQIKNIGTGATADFVENPYMKFWFLGSPTLGQNSGDEGIARDLPAGTLDICYDEENEFYYIIKYNDAGGLTEDFLSFDDDFTTVSGTSSFNPTRWTEDPDASSFNRNDENDNLAFSGTNLEGSLITNFKLENGFAAQIDWEDIFIPASGTGRFEIRIIDNSYNVIGSEGISSLTSNDGLSYFNLYAFDITNNTDYGNISYLRPKLTVPSGIETDWTISKVSTGTWNLTSTSVGINENFSSNTIYEDDYISFLVTENQETPNGQIMFFSTARYEEIRYDTSGTIGVSRDAGVYNGLNTSPAQIITEDDVRIELFAVCSGSFAITADNFAVTSGTGNYFEFPCFSIQRVSSNGNVVSDMVTVLDVINSLGTNDVGDIKTYNDFIGGTVGICTDNEYAYVKVENRLMRFDVDNNVFSSDGFDVLNTVGEIEERKTYCFDISAFNISTVSGGELPSSEKIITYQEYNSNLTQISLKTIDPTTLEDTTELRELLLKETEMSSSFDETLAFPLFFNRLDYNTLYLIETDGSLYQYNTDDRLVAFINVNGEDPTLSAGTGAGTNVVAGVCNAWGVPLSGKILTYSVSAGDGSVSPASRQTDNDGIGSLPAPGDDEEGYPVFTVGSSVSTSTITVTVNE